MAYYPEERTCMNCGRFDEIKYAETKEPCDKRKRADLGEGVCLHWIPKGE